MVDEPLEMKRQRLAVEHSIRRRNDLASLSLLQSAPGPVESGASARTAARRFAINSAAVIPLPITPKFAPRDPALEANEQAVAL